MSKQFDGKVVIVTGATSGIGRATAVAFGREGAKVVVAGRREEEGASAVKEIEAAGGQSMFVRTDVAKESDVQALVARTVERFGRLDIAFNNAGVFFDTGPVTEATDDIFDKTYNINVRGVMNCMKHQIPAMLKSGGGAIVNNASALGLNAMTNAAVYNSSKFAVVGLTKSAALEFAAQVIETDINAQMRNDPQVHSYMLAKHPIGRFGKEAEVASAVLWLCTPGAGFTTGIALPIDGGWTAQ
jgi:NAD(P)-dependent dehydrogenase (short-subunit alcohol dehydrogenase family)